MTYATVGFGAASSGQISLKTPTAYVLLVTGCMRGGVWGGEAARSIPFFHPGRRRSRRPGWKRKLLGGSTTLQTSRSGGHREVLL